MSDGENILNHDNASPEPLPDGGSESARQGFSLQNRYTVLEGRVAMNGVQALVRLPMEQYRRDQKAGLRVGTYITGYQGSPLGEVDRHMLAAGSLLGEHQIVWQGGINEEVAATAVYGTQLLDQFPHAKYDGLTGIWYGKGPGVDRSGDAFRHASYIGTTPYGAALALGGDDPSCKSSTIPSDSTVAFYDVGFPLFYPGDPREVLELGLHAIAMSRYSGLWSAMKIVTNVADGGAIFDVSPDMAPIVIPNLEINGKPFEKTQDIRLLPPFSNEIERLIHYERQAAALAYARANGLNRAIVRGSGDRIGLVASGKVFIDLMQALELLGLDAQALGQAGIGIYKMGLIAPIEPEGLTEFAHGLEDLVFVEEKRGFTEVLARAALYNLPQRPRIYGKLGPDGHPLFPINDELSSDQIAVILADYLSEKLLRPDLWERVRWLAEISERSDPPIMARTPYFCSGCPHNTSTNLPEGELTGGGIGCHAMAMYMERGVTWMTQMGGEGAPWMGLAPFVDREHLFQNVGDGTFFHSASKSLEACIASGVNMTLKVLYNATVAMTGGQDVVGLRTPLEIASMVLALGVKKVAIVAEEIEAYEDLEEADELGDDAFIAPKEKYNEVMRSLKEIPGVTVLIFDQRCAAEKRRMRKRGTLETPRKRVYINQAVCEGCGDCGVQSNCLSVVPVETEYGRKTQIHQSSCNMDYSCLKGDCPAFMTLEWDEDSTPLKKEGQAAPLPANLPEPTEKVVCETPYKSLLVGIGGTGVVTVDALLVTAALLEGKYAVNLDQTGLAQKGGAVLSNFILCDTPVTHANKIANGEADLLLAFDLLAAAAPDNLRRFHPERTVAVVNTTQSSTAEAVTNIHARLPGVQSLKARLEQYCREQGKLNAYLNAEHLSEALFGNHLQTNIFLLGVTYQKGLLPLQAESIEEAIRLNGVSVPANLQAFRWGRKFVLEPAAVDALLAGEEATGSPAEQARNRLKGLAPSQLGFLESMMEDVPPVPELAALLFPRISELILYQDSAYARRYLDRVNAVYEEEQRRTPGNTALAQAVARWQFKLMAYKDEYEVARLWLQDPLWAQSAGEYDGAVSRAVLLHPPLLRALGLKNKIAFGGVSRWVLFTLLSSMKGLRGSRLDLFGLPRIRREERRLIGWYEQLVDSLLESLSPANQALAVTIACAPDGIRGYEAIKERNIAETLPRAEEQLRAYQQQQTERKAG